MTRLPVSEQGIEIKAKKVPAETRDLFRTHSNSPDSNQGPSDLQSDALPTELPRQR